MRNETWFAIDNTWKRLGQTSTPPGGGSTPKPVVGAYAGDTQSSFQAFESQVGTLLIRRSYAGPGVLPADFASSNAGVDDGLRESIWSFKPTPSTFAAGGNDTWFNSFLDSIPNGHKTIIILWHEPEDNIRNNEFTLAEWKAANNHMGQLVHAKSRTELRSAINLMGPWTFNPSSPYYTTEYWDSGFTTNIDYIGFDPYCTTSSFVDLANDANFLRAMSWANTHSKQVILPEFGCIDDPGGNATKKATWITHAYQYSTTANMYAICYFNSNGSINNVPLTTPESIAAYSAANADSKV